MSGPSLHFIAIPTPAGTELRLLDGHAVIPAAAWALSGHPGADLCQRWVAEDAAVAGEDELLVEHAAISRLTAAEATRLDLPPASLLRAVVEGSGIMMRDDFVVDLRWTRPGGQTVLGVRRVGAWLQQADGWHPLPETLFVVSEAVAAYQAVAVGDEAARLSALAALRRALPPAALTGSAETSGLLGNVTIIEADAFSLATIGEGDAMRLVPVLHRAGIDNQTPLLPEDRERAFGTKQFYQWPTARGVYSLPGGVYVTVSPPLRQALELVRRTAEAPAATRRAFLAAPRAAIRAAISDEADVVVVEDLVVETAAWSERVIGLGLWRKRVLPWVAQAGNDWFGDDGTPPSRGIIVGDQHVPLGPKAAAGLTEQVTAAMQQGRPSITVPTPDGPLDVPATEETLAAIAALKRPQAPQENAANAPEIRVLVIKPNENDLEIEAAVQRRPAPPAKPPACLETELKAHQAKGLRWLQESWIAGSPGVLLADDMGLGKTLQGLAFLAWLREGMRAGSIARRPVLIVAPTGLLQNWQAEHREHLNPPGLGMMLLAFGRDLTRLRRKAASGDDNLDIDALANADWVLTTYETLRDYLTAFGAVHFAAMLLDEAQKVKTPGIRMTDAAKSMKADFCIAMTGTPVENRLSDLWCIVDIVAPGHLGALRHFSKTYEAERSPERLAQLKTSLDRPLGGRPALLLRRLRDNELSDLPPRTDNVTSGVMGAEQCDAYEAALALGRSDQGAGRVLEALQRLRAVSLHPNPAAATDDAMLIAGSARLKLVIKSLDDIAEQGERALVFIEDLALMARLVGVFQRRYRLAKPPLVINGSVSGTSRYARVQEFQHSAAGFDVMLLSPKAAGVGLTLTRANHVIHLSRWWNPAVEDQCTARIHRIGQQQPIMVHIPLAILPDSRTSFDQNLHALLDRKRRLMRDTLLPPEPNGDDLAGMLAETIGL